MSEAHPRPQPPFWPTALLGVLAVLATASIVQGIVDVVLPTLRGEDPFGFLFAQTARWGPAFFVGYVFVHNLGLAALVPGYGFVAARYERHTRNRFLIGLILAGSVVTALFVSLEFLVQAHERFDLSTAIPLFVAESVGVLVVTVAGARELKGFVPTRRYAWSLVTPFRRLGVPLAFAFTMLLLASLFEGWAVLSG